MSGYFGRAVVCDTEYEIAAGGLPNVLCMVAYVLDENLRHVETIRIWRGEFGSSPPFDIGPDTLFVAYSAWAEMMCFLVLKWKFPVHIYDLHTAYLASSNLLLPHNPDEERTRPRKRLSDACRAYGIAGWENIDKEVIAEDIGHGRWAIYGQDGVYGYCEEDVKKAAELLRKQLRGHAWFAPTNVELVLHWSNYSAKCIARIQAKGMPIDPALWELVQENKPHVITFLLREFDPSFSSEDPIYSPEGEWSYDRFEHWLWQVGVIAWPRLDSGKLDLSGDAFRLMYHVPGIEGLHALRDSLRVVAGAKLPIGPDWRNRPSLFPFGTATGRNAHRRSLYNVHAGMRSFMVFPPDRVGIYLDWRTQEIGVSASLSGDQALMDAYRGGDVYHAFALNAGLTTDPDRKHWAKTEQTMRQRVKALCLAINYGMAVPSLAKGLDRHPLIASHLIEQYKRLYPRFWQWRDDMVQQAMIDRYMETVFGWPLYLTSSPNRRTLMNFLAQGNASEMIRLATWKLCEAGIVPCMLVHDGILLELDSKDRIPEAIEIMRWAGREVCNGFEIGVDVDQLLEGGARYRDKRPVARAMWATIMRALQTIGVGDGICDAAG
ncbi:MAG TPA: DNA polymerase [Xanthobacteraceae bacterium]|nr:DNA polymerase [Xanthobacteraceae bacterium]